MRSKPHLICEAAMARHPGPVLVDTNVILECWRVGSWRALTGGYGVETVEDCVIETQTGFQRRRPEQQIDAAALRASLAAIHRPATKDFAEVAVRAPNIFLDAGEKALWAHTLTRNDVWVLCGPDKASLRFGVRLGFRDRLVSLEALLEAVGQRSKEPLRTAYTEKWLQATLGEFVLAEGQKK
jgi:hypothetical protein